MFAKNFFPPGRPPRLFEKGDLKYVILNLLKDKPAHGYEIMRDMEEAFHGFYTPSAGSVYPTLQMLDDMGYVSSSERDGKKVYTITEAGKQFLKEQQDVVAKIKGQMKDWFHPRDIGHLHEAMHELHDLGHLVGRGTRHLKADKWAQIKETITRARREIEELINNK